MGCSHHHVFVTHLLLSGERCDQGVIPLRPAVAHPILALAYYGRETRQLDVESSQISPGVVLTQNALSVIQLSP